MADVFGLDTVAARGLSVGILDAAGGEDSMGIEAAGRGAQALAVRNHTGIDAVVARAFAIRALDGFESPDAVGIGVGRDGVPVAIADTDGIDAIPACCLPAPKRGSTPAL